MKLLSTEAEGVNEAIPESLRSKLVNDVGRVGALLGLQAPQSQERSQGKCTLEPNMPVNHDPYDPPAQVLRSALQVFSTFPAGNQVNCCMQFCSFTVDACMSPAADQRDGTGAVPPRIENMPLTEVLLVNIKLLTLSELRLITDKGTEGRRQLSEAFAGPDRLVSSLHRAPLV